MHSISFIPGHSVYIILWFFSSKYFKASIMLYSLTYLKVCFLTAWQGFIKLSLCYWFLAQLHCCQRMYSVAFCNCPFALCLSIWLFKNLVDEALLKYFLLMAGLVKNICSVYFKWFLFLFSSGSRGDFSPILTMRTGYSWWK